MNEKAEKRKRSWRVLWIAISLFLIFPLLLCCGVATWFLGRQSSAMAKLDIRIADLDQRGEPVDDESLAIVHEANTSNKNSDAFVTVGQKLQSPEFVETTVGIPFIGAADEAPMSVPPPGEPWPDRKPVDAFLQRWQREIGTIIDLGIEETMRGQKPVRRPIEFNSIATLLGDTQNVRSMARLLRLQHAVAVHDRDTDSAMRCIRACRGLERSTFGEPIIISQLIGQALGRITNEMIQLSLRHDHLSDKQMDDVIEQLTSFQQLHKQYVYSMKGERAAMLPVFSDPDKANEIADMESPGSAKLMTKIRAIDALYFMDQMDLFIDIPDSSAKEFRDATIAVTKKFTNDIHSSSMLTKFDRLFSYMLIPAVESYASVLAQTEENNRLVKLAIGLRKYERKFGNWPKSLDELAQVGVDLNALKPIEESSFRYRVTKSGEAVTWGVHRSAVLWSIHWLIIASRD